MTKKEKEPAYKAEDIVFRNDVGLFNSSEPYTVADMQKLVGRIREGLSDYGSPLEDDGVRLETEYVTIKTLPPGETYMNERLKMGSQLRFRAKDGTLEGILKIGRDEDYEGTDEKRFVEKAARTAPGLAKDFGIILGSAVLGAVFRKPSLVGKAVANAGGFYGIGSAVMRVYNEAITSGFSTLKLMPQGELNARQIRAYKTFVRKNQ